jgi:hypothetical protein
LEDFHFVPSDLSFFLPVRLKTKAFMLNVFGEPNQDKSTDAAHLKEDVVHLKEDNAGCSHTNNENVDAGLNQLSKDGEDKVDKVEEPAEKF